MTDDLITLASAYLDGETTAAERAQVEADAELLAEVERLRQVRSVLGDTESAPISTRERHLAGALEAWDRLPTAEKLGDATPVGDDAAGAAGGASITAPISLRDRRAKRKPVSTRVLTAAAAVVVLAGAGIVVRGALESDDDSNISTADAPVDIGDGFDAPASGEFEASPEAAAEETFDLDSEADEPAVGAIPEAEAVIGGPEQAPGSDDLEVLSDDAELAVFANAKVISREFADAAPAEAADSEPASDAAAEPAAEAATDDVADAAPDTTLAPPVDLCDLVDEIVGFALWESSGLFNDPITVGINNATGEAIAYDDESCTEIARTPLPTP